MDTRPGRAHARRILAAAIIGILALAIAAPAASAAPKTKLISVNSAGNQSGSSAGNPDINANGNQVVFESVGSFVPADTNDWEDIYARNVSKKKTRLVGLTRSGVTPDDYSATPESSASGRYVAFESEGDNITSNFIGTNQVYRRDLVAGTTKLVSAGGKGVANVSSSGQDISANGRYVVFYSAATNLTSKNTFGQSQIYLRDMAKKKTFLISQTKGMAGNGDSGLAAVSGNGRYVAFGSLATNLSPKDEHGVQQVFLRDRKLKKTFLISKGPGGKPGTKVSRSVAISDNGRVLVFLSAATDLLSPGKDSNLKEDIYKYDRVKKRMTRVSVDRKGRQFNDHSFYPEVSADGRVVVFGSEATNTIKGGANGSDHVYRRGPAASSIRLVSRDNNGQQGNGNSRVAAVSADGTWVVFHSRATNLTKGTDKNGARADIFRVGPF